jgi:hypothetical protein
MNPHRRALTESVAAAVCGYIVAAILEATIIRWVRPTEWELAWVSDVVLAVALGFSVYLWRHLLSTRRELQERERAELVLQTQLSIAADIQNRLLPAVPPTDSGFEWAAALKSAGKIGGDFYDFVEVASTLSRLERLGRGLMWHVHWQPRQANAKLYATQRTQRTQRDEETYTDFQIGVVRNAPGHTITPWYEPSCRFPLAFELGGHPDQFGQRIGLHLPHDVSALDLDRDLAGAERRGDLLVEHARGDQAHDLAFARSERGVTTLQQRQLTVPSACGLVAVQRQPDRVQQFLIFKRLRQELDRSRLHGLDRRRNIAVAGDEDDRNRHAGLRQLPLNVETARARQPDVQDQACGSARPATMEEFLGCGEGLASQPRRLQQSGDRRTHIRIVVDDEHDRVAGRSIHVSREYSAYHALQPARQGAIELTTSPNHRARTVVIPTDDVRLPARRLHLSRWLTGTRARQSATVLPPFGQ